DGEEMAMEPAELVGDDPAVLGALRHLDAGDRFARHRPAVVAEHRRDVVDAVGVGDEAVPAHLLRDLLDRAVEVADVRDGLLPDPAVGPDDEAEHAVRRRMLRTHRQRHVLGDDAAVGLGTLHLDFESGETHALSRLSRDVGMPWYSCGSTKSLRSGWPGQSSGIRMRRRSGWPSNVTPRRSYTSRSCQSAVLHTGTTAATTGSSRVAFTLSTPGCPAR